MDRSTWKKWERWWVAALGGDRVNGKRNPVTGRHSGDTPDIETIKFAGEVKAGRKTQKIPIVCQTHKVNQNNAIHLVTMDLETFLQITTPIRKEEMRIKKSLDSTKSLGI